ncbi:LVIVD repeat-containing protein [Stenotrophobium rhamnosiphilum]|uniref:Methanethiol oxidase n=1 Tax=Stenotrophobium rhamnosiphilum TaxID=2029166 RepID=A0A2T5MDA3_9GAMM|nr:hypothetical protein [Stenotrophobium rhamnosiphilum]PTU30553.1 hypothetical protein CJD38_13680 [Stenotrophobium rhamnosiphilum]
MQGRLSQADIESGLALRGITCNTELVGSYTTPKSYATVGGWKVERYVDSQGNECAYYDASNIFPLGILDGAIGVNVMDMNDPTHPVLIEQLLTPAMLSPHESLNLSEKRGLLIAVNANPAVGPGIVDIYDLTKDCRHPVLKSISLTGLFGHESGVSPDGLTFFSGSPITSTIAAIDISNPEFPLLIWSAFMDTHGLSVSADGNRAYVADTSGKMRILDISQIQARLPNPKVKTVSETEWEHGSIPQNAVPFTSKGKPYVLEFDEFGAASQVGAGRIIDISNEAKPKVISNLRLEVHQPENFAAVVDDPGAGDTAYGGYSAHYCDMPTRVDPTIVACSMILSGLRIFDIRDPYHPREVAYFNAPLDGEALSSNPGKGGAVSRPAFAPERKEVWYTDSNSGFFAVRVTNGAWP